MFNYGKHFAIYTKTYFISLNVHKNSKSKQNSAWKNENLNFTFNLFLNFIIPFAVPSCIG